MYMYVVTPLCDLSSSIVFVQFHLCDESPSTSYTHSYVHIYVNAYIPDAFMIVIESQLYGSARLAASHIII